MKYTKYQYKKKNNGIKFLTSLVMTTLAAISIGLLGAYLILKIMPNMDKLKEVTNTQIEENNSNNTTTETLDIENFTVIQCGYFAKEANATQILSKIGDGFNSFIAKDNEGKFKVIAGITKEENSSEVMQKLKDKGIENVKVKVALNKNDNIQNQISAITNGYLEILDTAGKDDVKEVNTNDFKSWMGGLEEITEGNKVEVLNEYKEHIKALPEIIDKTKVITELEYIYSILNKI